MFRNSINNIGDCIWKLILMVNSCRKFNYFILLIVLKILPLTASHNIIHPPKYMTENSTEPWPQNITHFSDVPLLLQNKSTPATNKSFICHCSTTVGEIGIDIETECHCNGLKLLRIPQNLFPSIQRLTVASAGLKILKGAGLNNYSSTLRDIMLTNLNDFSQIEAGAFRNITNLRSLYISHAPKLQYIGAETFQGISSKFKTLRIIHCGLKEIPNLNQLSTGILLQLDFEGNQISEIGERAVHVKTEQLILDNNALTYVHKFAFANSEIAKLSFKGNKRLRKLHDLAFADILNIQELDLSSTSIEALPTVGLSTLEYLRIKNTQTLKHIPSVYNFKNLQKAWLTHSFHCCAFKFPSRHDPPRHAQQIRTMMDLQNQCISKGFMAENGQNFDMIDTVLKHEASDDSILTRTKRRVKRWTKTNFEQLGLTGHFNTKATDNQSNNYNAITGSPMQSHDDNDFFHEHQEPSDIENGIYDGFLNTTVKISDTVLEALCGNLTKDINNVKCYPVPDALNPCEDVMGSNWLRASVWIVVLLAVIGNAAVLIVLFSNRSDLTVPKFLMCNLSFADFCMGSYLLLIASIDIHSMGEYFNFAFDWQYGFGCQTAGFLTVFASHLSIFTLTIITIERWFAITHAIYLNKRLKLKAAMYIMLCGWIYSITMASLPLFGMSNYSSTSICLPMEARDNLDYFYLVTVLGVNGFGFVVIVICYAQIYFSLGKETRVAARNASSGEMTVAKKMALLVFTNFACWAPIAFFGLTALAGYPLIDVTKSKILLVFFYPLNSCANPYLYAILTSQYRRDLFLLLSKYGFCTQRAQQYKMTYSIPTNTIPLNMISKSSNGSNNYRKSRSSGSASNHGLPLIPVRKCSKDEHQTNGKTTEMLV